MHGATPSLRGLYAITPDWQDTAPLLTATEAILASGGRLLQYRNKTADAALRLAHATALRQLTRRYAATLIINDDLALALAVDADGVHLGAEDGDLNAARQRLGAAKILGASCYQSAALAEKAAAAGADYVAFGSFFASPTKPHAPRAAIDLLHDRRDDLPVCAIGGITTANAPTLIAAGADMLAVISALYNAADIAATTQHFLRLFEPPS
jgi:thiamine-phosphate pyrophosphorylase